LEKLRSFFSPSLSTDAFVGDQIRIFPEIGYSRKNLLLLRVVDVFSLSYNLAELEGFFFIILFKHSVAFFESFFFLPGQLLREPARKKDPFKSFSRGDYHPPFL